MESKIVKTINQYFHDEEAIIFSERHKDRINCESLFYHRFFTDFFYENKKRIKILDVGTGTGLVAKAMPEADFLFVCTDISQNMLDVTRKTLKNKKGTFEYLSCDAEKLPFAPESFNVITCNAAMHHMPSIKNFTLELNRVLVPGGMAILGFEANQKFWSTKVISLLHRILSRIGIRDKGDGIGYNTICEEVNRRLLKEGVIKKPMMVHEILSYVDVHSPNAGEKIDYAKGFDVTKLLNESFINYSAEAVYHYEGISGILKILIKTFYPKAAPQFSLVLKKKIL